MRDDTEQNEIRLVASGKYWGTLRIDAGRLLLDCQRHGQQVQFDLLASVEQRRAVGRELVRVCASIREDLKTEG